MVATRTHDFFRDKVVLVTGAHGYIGGCLVQKVAPFAKKLICQSRQFATPPAAVDGRQADIIGDIAEDGLWDSAPIEEVDVVFHLAAQTSIYTAVENPLDDLAVNVHGTLELLEAIRRRGRRPAIVLASTATVAGLTPQKPVNESWREQPVTLYDIHKLTVEHYLRFYAMQGWLRGASLRLANVYGPGFAEAAPDRGVITRVIGSAMEGKTIQVYRPGTWLRDYVFIDDVVSAFLLAAENAEALDGLPYVIGTGCGSTLIETMHLAVLRVRALTGRKGTVKLVDPPEGLSAIEFRDFVADATAFRNVTGWQPEWTLQSGIDRTVEARAAV